MSLKENDIFEESKKEAFEEERSQQAKDFTDVLLQDAKDNIFSANHRNAMIQRHGFTSAEWITIDNLLKN